MKYFAPISISLSPNTEKDDIKLAFQLIFAPWKWRKGKAIKELEKEFREYMKQDFAFAFNSGRSSFLAILKGLELPENSDVLLQAFTCNAAANPILWAGHNPIYIDCDSDTFNMSVTDLKAKITPNSRAILVQHTFGLPANMDEIVEVAKEHNLIVVEDCAHALGSEYKGKKVGSFGKAAFYSFSRDKIISSVYGGMAITNDAALAEKIGKFQEEIGYPSSFWVFQQLLHPVLLNWIILPIYKFMDLGKIFLILSQYSHILSKAVHWKEKRGKMPDYFPKQLPNGLAILARHQFVKLDRFYKHREEISNFYYNELKSTNFKISQYLSPEYLKQINFKHSFLRFTVCHQNAYKIIHQAWDKENILIGDWYTCPIAPCDTQIDKLRYTSGSCPNAERLSKMTLNLPTHINISRKNALRVVNFLKNF